MLLFQPEISRKSTTGDWQRHGAHTTHYSYGQERGTNKILKNNFLTGFQMHGFRLKPMFCLSFCSVLAAKEHVVAQNPAIVWLNSGCKLPNPQACTPQVGHSLELRLCPWHMAHGRIQSQMKHQIGRLKPTKQGRETFRSLITLV